MKKLIFALIALFILSGSLLWAKTEKIKCSSSLVTFDFENVKLKKIKFVDENEIRYMVNADSFSVDVSVKDGNIMFKSKNPDKKAKISLFLPKNKVYQTYIENSQLCKFDNNSIEAEIGEEQKVIIRDGTVKILDRDGNSIVSVGDNGIFVNDQNQTVRIDGNGIFIKENDDEVKNYNGFWAKLLGKTIKGFTGLIMDMSLKNIGKNVVKIINEQNLRIVADKMESINIDVNVAKQSEELEKDFVIRRKSKLNIDNFNGDITIKPSFSDSLIIKAKKFSRKEKNLKKITVAITNENDSINIKSTKTDPLIEGGVKITIYCPKKVSLEDIRTSNGDISIYNAQGKLNAISSNGDIFLTKFKGDAKALTSNGDIIAKEIFGKANLVTSNGEISGKTITDLAVAKTSNGKIDLEKVRLVTDLSTSNDKIYLQTDKILDDTTISTSNGNITLLIPSNSNLTIKAETTNGNISVKNLQFSSQSKSDQSFTGILGNGKARVYLKTSNADIIIKKK